jgi:glycosyltransferase involved in cell wall biosynthesis
MISFIIPARNEELYITDCLKSIYDQQAQENIEVIVVDNLSTDSTVKKVAEFFPLAKVVSETVKGTSAARQRGFLESRGEIVIFLDADVRLSDRLWLNKLIRKFNKCPGLVAVSSHYRYYGMSLWYKFWQIIGTFGFVYPWVLLTNNILGLSAHMIGGMMAVRRPSLEACGGFDINTEFFGDETLIARRLYKQGDIEVSPSLWVWTSGRRHSQEGMFKTVFGYLWNYFWVLLSNKPYNQKGYREVR